MTERINCFYFFRNGKLAFKFEAKNLFELTRTEICEDKLYFKNRHYELVASDLKKLIEYQNQKKQKIHF